MKFLIRIFCVISYLGINVFGQNRFYQNPIDTNRFEGNNIGSIPGAPGRDYPTFATPPETSFRCQKQSFPGYYADPETRCQVFHICQTGNIQNSFLCPNGTLFNQEYLVCDWWHHVDCAETVSYYGINEIIKQAMDAATQQQIISYRINTQNQNNLIRNKLVANGIKGRTNENLNVYRGNVYLPPN